MAEAEIDNYFEDLRSDLNNVYYGMYFLEVADYYTRENNAEAEMLKLLYQSLRALSAKGLHKELVRYIFEIRALAANGEYPGIPDGREWKESTLYAMHYIEKSPIEKLYTFTVTGEILEELKQIAEIYRRRFMDREMKSLRILEGMDE